MSRLHQFICAHWPWLSRQCGPPAEYMVAAMGVDAWPYTERRRANSGPPLGVERRKVQGQANVKDSSVHEYEHATREVIALLEKVQADIVMQRKEVESYPGAPIIGRQQGQRQQGQQRRNSKGPQR